MFVCVAPADDVAIKLQGDFTWDPDKPPTLTGLHLNITRGQLVAVVGPTGSGKTSLMSAILGLLQGVTQDEECECLRARVQGLVVFRLKFV